MKKHLFNAAILLLCFAVPYFAGVALDKTASEGWNHTLPVLMFWGGMVFQSWPNLFDVKGE
jgi:hypothetical protein